MIGYDMKFTLKQEPDFSWQGVKGWVFNTKEDFANASAAYIEMTGKHGKIKCTNSDRLYFVVGGKGRFWIDGREFEVMTNDLIIVSKNTPYDFRGIGLLKLFKVSCPAFNPKGDVKLE